MYKALVGLTLVLAWHASPTIADETILTNADPAVQDVSVTLDQDTTATQTTLLLETFDGPDSDTVGNGWLELEVDKGTVARSGNRLVFSTQDTKNRPMVSRTFPRVSSDTVVWEFEFDWARTGRDYNYRLFMQLGDGAQMREDYWDAGVAVNLMWSSVGSHEQLGYRTGGGVTELAQISGPTKLQVVVNTAQATYDVLIDGVPVATALPFDQATAFDTVRFFTDSVKAPHFSGMAFDTVKITTDGSAPGNSAPSAQAQTVAVDPDTTANVTLGYTDPDGPGPYTFTVVQGPTNGTLGSNDGDAAVTYTPAAGYSGTDSFTFRVNDGLDDSSTATVSLSVGTQTTLLMETFDGPDSDTVGNGWVELEVDKGTVARSGNRLVLSTQDTTNRPIVSRTFPRVTSGAVAWEFEFDWARTGRDYNYRLFMQLGDSVQMREDYWDAGVAVNLMWSSVGSHEQLGYRTDGGVTGLTQISGPTKLQVLVNASQGTYDVLIDGVLAAAALPFDQATGFDTVRFFTDSVKAPHFSGMAFDTVAITTAGGAPANTIPTALAQSVTLDQDTTANVALGYTDADDGPGPYTFTVVQGPANGALGSDDGNAGVSYTPTSGYSGPDSFTFRVNDGLDDSDTATVNFTVEAVVTNTAPTAQSQSVTLNQDTTANVTLGYTDADGPGPYTFTVVQGPANGTLGSNDGDASVTYIPAAGYSGPDSFTFRVNDGLDDSDTATVNFTVEAVAVNTAPTAEDQSVILDQDTTANLTLGVTDPDGPGPYTFTIVQGPANGTLVQAPADDIFGGDFGDALVTYTPTSGYSGPDSFTFRVNDGLDDSVTATVSIAVEATNTSPTAQSQSVTLDQDTTADVTLGYTDADGPGPYTFTIVQGPANGTLSSNDGDASVTYTTASGYSGPDSFTFSVNDGLDDSTTATVSLTVDAVNTAPTAQAQSVTLDQDTTANVTLGYTDADGPGPYTFTVVQGPANGTIGSNDGDASVTYTPAAGYSGPDSFTFRVNDGLEDSTSATVSLTVDATNSVPTAQTQSVTLDQDTTANVTLGYTDADGPGPYTFTVVQGPANGTLGSNDGDASLTYTPASGYSGQDSFTFRVNDGLDDSTTATVSITVEAVNNPPTAQAQSVTLDQDTTANVTLAYTDADGPGPYSFTIVQAPANGAIGSNDGDASVTYTPASSYSGPDSFTFRVNDGLDDSSTATISFTVDATNTAPTPQAQSVTLDQDTTANVTLGYTDPDGPGPYTFTIVQAPANGAIGSNDGDAAVTYTPATGYSGPDSFTFSVNDGLDDSTTATVNFTVDAVNNPPTAQAQSVTVDQDTTANVTLAYTDADGPGPYTFTVVQAPANGAIGSNDGDASVTYTPATGYSGPDSFTFSVNDGLDDSTTVTVSLTIDAVNTAPTAQSQNVTLDQDTTTNVTLAYTDADGPGPYTFMIVQGPTNGTIGSNDGDASVTYTPATGYSGSDSFTFRVNDGLNDSATATISLTVEAINTAPTAQSQSVTLEQDTTANITLGYTDADGPGPYTFTIVQGPANGTLGSNDGDASVTYTPATAYSGPDSFTFRVNDGLDDSNTATVSLSVGTPTTLLMETFDGPDSGTIGNGWVEMEVANGTVARSGNRLVFSSLDTLKRPIVSRPFPRVTSGEAVWEFEFDWARIGSEGIYHLFMQLGDGALMSADDWDAGVAVNLMWSAIGSHEQLGYRAAGGVTGLTQISGPTTLRVLVNVSQSTYDVLIDGVTVSTALPFDQATAFDTVRFFTDEIRTSYFSGNAFDTVTITTGGGGPGNTIPTAQSQSLTLNQDTTADVTLGYTDADGPGPYTFTVVQGPANGMLGGDDGDALVTYTPNATYTGPDSFTFRVNDGLNDSATATVSLTVEPQGNTGSATLSWSAPTQNTDGTTLTDLSAYRIYYGTSSGTYPNQITIDNPGITTYVVENLPADTYYFVSTAINSSGVESDHSNIATKVVD